MAHIRLFRHYIHTFYLLMAAAEGIILTGTAFLGFFTRNQSFPPDTVSYLMQAVSFAVVMVVSMASMGVYEARVREGYVGMMLRTAVAVFLLGTMGTAIVSYFVSSVAMGRGVLLFSTIEGFILIAMDLDYVGVKAPMFSFSRLTGADPLLGVEMASTGEVGCLGTDMNEALLHALLSTGFKFPENGVLLSLGRWEDKFWFAEEARTLAEDLGLPIYATEGTSQMLDSLGIKSTSVGKGEDAHDAIYDLFTSKSVDLVINVPRDYDQLGRPDGYLIRRSAIDCGVPLITDRQLAGAVVEALRSRKPDSLQLVALGDHQRDIPVVPTLPG